MSTYQEKNIIDIVNGYIKCIKMDTIPDDIILLICVFYDKIILFDAMNNERKLMIKKCKKLFVNGDSYFFVNNDNKLFVYGDNEYDQLGRHTVIAIDLIYTRKFFDDKEIQIISQGNSGYHCFIHTSNKLYGFGSNRYGQLGMITRDDVIESPLLIEYKFKSKLKAIKCGKVHTLFLTIKGNVYGCGKNSHRQLTSKYCYGNHVIIQKIVKTNNIKSIYCADNTSYILNDDNILMAFGNNYHGQLGVKNEFCRYSGNINIIFNGVNMFSCGGDHIGYLTLNNEIYMFGCNYNGECGYNFKIKDTVHNGNKIIPRNKIKITHIMCGCDHNIIKTINNGYYSFGSNKFHQLLVETKQTKVYTPMLISKKYVYNITGNNARILDLIPSIQETLIIQQK